MQMQIFSDIFAAGFSRQRGSLGRYFRILLPPPKRAPSHPNAGRLRILHSPRDTTSAGCLSESSQGKPRQRQRSRPQRSPPRRSRSASTRPKKRRRSQKPSAGCSHNFFFLIPAGTSPPRKTVRNHVAQGCRTSPGPGPALDMSISPRRRGTGLPTTTRRLAKGRPGCVFCAVDGDVAGIPASTNRSVVDDVQRRAQPIGRSMSLASSTGSTSPAAFYHRARAYFETELNPAARSASQPVPHETSSSPSSTPLKKPPARSNRARADIHPPFADEPSPAPPIARRPPARRPSGTNAGRHARAPVTGRAAGPAAAVAAACAGSDADAGCTSCRAVFGVVARDWASTSAAGNATATPHRHRTGRKGEEKRGGGVWGRRGRVYIIASPKPGAHASRGGRSSSSHDSECGEARHDSGWETVFSLRGGGGSGARGTGQSVTALWRRTDFFRRTEYILIFSRSRNKSITYM